jgi:hypothetical protein
MPLDIDGFLMALPDDTGGQLIEVDIATPVDNVFTFSAGGKVYKRVVDGVYRAAWIINGVGDQTSRLQAVFNHADVNEVIFDKGDVTVSGTLTIPAGKKITFKGNGRIVGAGTINGGIYKAGMRQTIFGSSIIINPEGITNSTGYLSAIWFGADPTGTATSHAAIQAAIDCVARNNAKISTVFLPVGSYTCSNGLLLYKKSGPNYIFHTVNLVGEGSWWQSSTGGTTLTFSNKNSFGIGVQLGKGNIIRGLKLSGPFTPPTLTSRQFFNTEIQDYNDGTVINTAYAGLFGLVVEPFVNNDANEPSSGTWATQGYPGWTSYYEGGSQSSNTGSTGIIMEDLFFTGWDACICFSPNTFTRNAEQIRGRKIQFERCRVALNNTQDQEKTNTFQHMGCWGDVNTVFAKYRWGVGTPGVYHVSDVNIAGNVRQFIDHVEGGYFASHFDRIFSERMGRFGRLQSLKGATVSNSEIGFCDSYSCNSQQKDIEATGVTFRNCTIRHYGELTPVTIVGLSTYEGCNFEVTPWFGAWQDLQDTGVSKIPNFINCFVDSSSADGAWCGSLGQQSSNIVLHSGNKLISPFGRKRLTHAINVGFVEYTHDVDYILPYADIYCGSKAATLAIVDAGGGFTQTREISLTISGTDKWLWGNGQKLAVYTSELGYIGNVHSVTDTEVKIHHIVDQWVDGTYNFFTSHPIWHHHFSGSVAGGSNIISNVILGHKWMTMANHVGLVIESVSGVNDSLYSRWNIVIAQDGTNFTCLKNFYYTIDDCVFSTAEQVTIKPKNVNIDPNISLDFKFIRGDKLVTSRIEELGKVVTEEVTKSGSTIANTEIKPLNGTSGVRRTVTANTGVLFSDEVIIANTTSGNITISIPNRVYLASYGGFWTNKYTKTFKVIKSSADANTVTINAFSGQNFSGLSSITLTTQDQYVEILVSDSGNFLVNQSPSLASGSGITSLNTLTGAIQTFAVGTTGTDFAIVSTGTSHTFNIPDAGASARGLVSSGVQTIAGNKTFTGITRFNDGVEANNSTWYLSHVPSAGSIILGVDSTTCYVGYTLGSRNIDLGTSTTGLFRVKNTGNTIIGTTSDNGTKLQVEGSIHSSNLAGTGNRRVASDSNGVLINLPDKIRVVNDADITVASDDYVLVETGNSSNRNITLPTASAITNRELVIRAAGTSSLTTSVAMRTTSASTKTLIQAGESVIIKSDGTDWWLIMQSTVY